MDRLMNLESKQITLLLIGLFAAIVLIVLGTLLNQDEEVKPEQVEQREIPEDVEPEVEDSAGVAGVTDEQSVDEHLPEQSEERELIGNRILDGEEAGTAELLEEGEGIVLLLEDKTMSENALNIHAGDTLTWQNQDISPHLLLIEKDGLLVQRGSRMEPGGIYSYRFSTAGDYLVRDVFSGGIRMTVAVS